MPFLQHTEQPEAVNFLFSELSLLNHAAALFFRSAQRFFMAWPIFLRAAAERWRLRPSGLPEAVLPALPLL